MSALKNKTCLNKRKVLLVTATFFIGVLLIGRYTPSIDFPAIPHASATVSLGLDGDAGATSGSSSVTSESASLTTTETPDVIIADVAVSCSGETVSVSDGDSLSWTQRASENNGHGGYIYEFYAIANSLLSSDSIKGTISPSCKERIVVFGVAGANTNSPFDPNAAIPGVASGSSTVGTVTVSTTNSNDFIFGNFLGNGSPGITEESGFNTIVTEEGNTPFISTEYEIFTSAQTNLVVKETYSASQNWAVIADAIEAAPSNSGGSGTSGGPIDSSEWTNCPNTEQCVASITSTKTNDLYYVIVASEVASATFSTPTDSLGKLTFQSRAPSSTNNGLSVASFYATYSGTLTNDAITCYSSVSAQMTCEVIAITGENSGNPFDGATRINSGSGTALSITYTTTNPDDILLGIAIGFGTPTISDPIGFTGFISAQNPNVHGAYQEVTATESAYQATFTASPSEPWYTFGEAIVENPGTPSVLDQQVGNGIQDAQDYLNFLTTYDPGCTPNNGNCAFEKEYANPIPLYIQWTAGCTNPNPAAGEPTSYESVEDVIGGKTSGVTGYSIINGNGQTSEEYEFDFGCSVPQAGEWSSSPALQVTMIYNGFGGFGPTFTIKYSIYFKSYSAPQGTFNIYLGDYEVASGVTSSNVGNTWSQTSNATPMTSPFNTLLDGQASFNLGQAGANNLVTGQPDWASFRYTVRSGTQTAYKWVQQSSLMDQGETLSTLQNQLYEVGAVYGFPTNGEDVYAPIAYHGQGSDPTSWEDNPNSGGIYNDCYTSLPIGVDENGIGYYQPYSSKVCSFNGVGVSVYLDYVWGTDPIVMGNTAILELLQYGPTTANVPWEDPGNGGVCNTISPLQFMTDLTTDGWIVSDSSTGNYVVAYPTNDPNEHTNACKGNNLVEEVPGTTDASGDRTGVIAELATLLAYKYGYTQFDNYATGLIQSLIYSQWGTTYSSLDIGAGYVNGASGLIFRPFYTGGQDIGWLLNDNKCTGGLHCVIEDNPQTGLPGLDLFNMPSEYLGYIPANQESTQETLMALETYWQYAIDNYQGTSGINDGIQPFFHWILDNTQYTEQTHTFDIYGLWPNGNMYLNLVLDDEGDGTSRCLNVWLDGSQIVNCQVIGPYYSNTFNQFTISLGSLSAGAHRISIAVTTWDYYPNGIADWWTMSAAIDDPPAWAPAGTFIVPPGYHGCPTIPTQASAQATLALAQTMNNARDFKNCVNPIVNPILNGTSFIMQTSP